MRGQLWAFLKSEIWYICQEIDEQADTFRVQLQDACAEGGGARSRLGEERKSRGY